MHHRRTYTFLTILKRDARTGIEEAKAAAAITGQDGQRWRSASYGSEAA